MEFLPRTDLNFDKLADEVSTAFFAESIPLNEGVIKVARQLQLNPEQCRRLVEKTNTQATVKMLRAALDKKAEFKLANFEEVRQVTHPSTAPEPPAAEKTAAQGEIPAHLPATRKASRLEKVAFASLDAPAPARKNPMAAVFAAEKTIEELTRQKLAAELRVQDRLDFIISEFSTWKAPDFAKFAGEALALHGDTIAPMLEQVGAYLGEPKDFAKVAYVVDDSQPLLKKAEEVLSGLNRILELDHLLKEAQTVLTSAWEAARHGTD